MTMLIGTIGGAALVAGVWLWGVVRLHAALQTAAGQVVDRLASVEVAVLEVGRACESRSGIDPERIADLEATVARLPATWEDIRDGIYRSEQRTRKAIERARKDKVEVAGITDADDDDREGDPDDAWPPPGVGGVPPVREEEAPPAPRADASPPDDEMTFAQRIFMQKISGG